MDIGFPMPATVKVSHIGEVTYEVIQHILYEAYRLHRFNPRYVFLSPRNCQAFRTSWPREERRIVGVYAAPFGVDTLVNRATSKVVDVIPLPHFDDSTVILGFLED